MRDATPPQRPALARALPGGCAARNAIPRQSRGLKDRCATNDLGS